MLLQLSLKFVCEESKKFQLFSFLRLRCDNRGSYSLSGVVGALVVIQCGVEVAF